MRAAYILTIAFLMMTSCNEPVNKAIEFDGASVDSVSKALGKETVELVPITREQVIAQIAKDTCLLGLKYGMSSEQIDNHSISLHKKNILKMNKDGKYFGLIETDNQNYVVFAFAPFVQDRTMYGLGLSLYYPKDSIPVNYSVWTNLLDKQLGKHKETKSEHISNLRRWSMYNVDISLWPSDGELSLVFRNTELETLLFTKK